jgi:hypothetical protein
MTCPESTPQYPVRLLTLRTKRQVTPMTPIGTSGETSGLRNAYSLNSYSPDYTIVRYGHYD